ncbi:recombination protein NinG [Testudinibacter sp. P80/BLE/0925]
MTKEMKPKKCKQCGNLFYSVNSLQKVCSVGCAMAFSRTQAELKQAKEERKRTKERKERLKRRPDWLRDAQAVFNKFIRLRDKDEPCISCGRHHQGQYHAGHYRSVGAAPELRFCELNVHKQCAPCNNHKSGNAIEYRINLIKKIGADKVEFLERQDHPPAKMSIDEIKAVIKHYKEKVKALEAKGS